MNLRDGEEWQYGVVVLLASLLLESAVIGLLTFMRVKPEKGVGKEQISGLLSNRARYCYPFTLRNAMWLMFFLGMDELWVRIHAATVKADQCDRGHLPEDDSTMLRVKDLVPIYKNVISGSQSRNSRQQLRTVLTRQCDQSTL